MCIFLWIHAIQCRMPQKGRKSVSKAALCPACVVIYDEQNSLEANKRYVFSDGTFRMCEIQGLMNKADCNLFDPVTINHSLIMTDGYYFFYGNYLLCGQIEDICFALVPMIPFSRKPIEWSIQSSEAIFMHFSPSRKSAWEDKNWHFIFQYFQSQWSRNWQILLLFLLNFSHKFIIVQHFYNIIQPINQYGTI